MSRFPLSSLRLRLLLLVLLAILPALGLLLYSISAQRRLALRDARADALRLTRLTASNLDRILEGARQLLPTLAQFPEVRTHDARACSALFAHLLKQYQGYTNFGAARPDGEVFCSGVPLIQSVSIADREWFQRTLKTRELTFSDHQVGRITGKSLIGLGYPLLDASNRVQGVVFLGLDLGRFGEVVAKTQLPDGAALMVIDRKGMVLARHPDPERWVGQTLPDAPLVKTILTQGEGTTEVRGADGTSRLFAFTPVPSAVGAVYMGVGISKEAAFAEANRIFALSLEGLGLVAVMALAAAWVVADLVILRRVNALVQAAHRLSAGDLSARAEVRGADEIGTMARAFNTMAERLEVRTREVALLQQMGEMLQACSTIQEAYDVIGRLAGQLFPEKAGAVFAITPSRNLVEVGAAWGDFAAGGGDVFSPDECWALRRGQPHLVEDTGSGMHCKHLSKPLPQAYMCIPLVAQGEALGVLYLSTPQGGEALPGGFTKAKQRLAATVAEQVALAMGNLRLRETLRSESIRDPLTGLFNRRYMEEFLEREVHRAQRGQRPMGVIMLDIDHFKKVNDTLGHDAGDAVLHELGTLLKAKLRIGDIACRYGGEEFILILPEASLEDARRRAEQLREAVKRLRVSHRGQTLEPFNVSLGVAAFPDHGETTEALIRAADTALYRAKAEGRDRVMVAE